MYGQEWPPNNPEILSAIRDLFDSGTWWIYKGPVVRAFEERFAASHGCRYGVSVCNGMVALDLILEGLGIGAGDRVALPAYNYYSLPKSVLNAGAEPLFVDLAADNMTIDPAGVEAALRDGARAVVAAHISGCTADVSTLRKLCDRYGAFLIEDAAQAHAASLGGKRVGGWGKAGLFSFGGVKLMTCGQGGMIVTDDRDLYERCYAIANRGLLPSGGRNPHGIFGDNFQLSELSAAILGPQLDRLDALSQRREQRMAWLDREIQQIPGLRPTRQFPEVTCRAQMAHYCFVDWPATSVKNKQKLLEAAKHKDIPLGPGYQSISRDAHYFDRFVSTGDFPNADRAQNDAIGFHHPLLLRDDRFWIETLERLAGVMHPGRNA